MTFREISVFSPCGEFFVCANDAGSLLIWETATNVIKQEFNIISRLNTHCSSLTWGSFENIVIEAVNKKKECQLLIIGTEAGGVYCYDYSSGALYNHFNSDHTDAVNDFSLNVEENILFSCSRDKTVISWDIKSGEVLKKWKTGDEELHSICIVDSNNLLTASTSVLWWNVKDQNIIKKFSCNEMPITHLRVVKSAGASIKTYFLGASTGDTKISAWELNDKNSKSVVASFNSLAEIQNIDVNDSFSKDNPLLLTAVTKDGTLVLFQHVLNGKTKKLTPQMTLQIMSKAGKDVECCSIPVISSKILDCAESCIIAYGSKENPVFESVNIFECPKKLTLCRENPILKVNKIVETKVSNKISKGTVANGQTSSIDSLCSSPKRRKHRDAEIIHNSPESSGSSSELPSSTRIPEKSSPNVKKKHSSKKLQTSPGSSDSNFEVHTVPKSSSEMVNFLIRGIEEERPSLINTVLQCDDSELIRSSVRSFPLHSLNLLLLELHKRLISEEKRYSSNSRIWLKETLTVHLPFLVTRPELTDILNDIRQHIDKRKVNETLLKMHMLKGLLNIHLQNLSSDDSEDSSGEGNTEVLMES